MQPLSCLSITTGAGGAQPEPFTDVVLLVSFRLFFFLLFFFPFATSGCGSAAAADDQPEYITVASTGPCVPMPKFLVKVR